MPMMLKSVAPTWTASVNSRPNTPLRNSKLFLTRTNSFAMNRAVSITAFFIGRYLEKRLSRCWRTIVPPHRIPSLLILQQPKLSCDHV